MICEHRKNQRCSFPCVLPILAQIFGFKSSDMHLFPFQYILCVGFIFCIKAAGFKALKQQYPVIAIILLSEEEQFGLGGSILFFDVSPVKAISEPCSRFVHSRFCCRGCSWGSFSGKQDKHSPSLSASMVTAFICSEIAFLCPERLCKFTQE